jgi:hypothetical protein
VLVLNRLLAPQPLVHVETWLAGTALPDLWGLEAPQCNDDRLARTLDALHPHLAALWQDLVVAAVRAFGLDLSRLAYDRTSVAFCGAYEGADLVRFGYSRDHRPDRKQVELATTVTVEGGVPLDYRVLAGNVADCTTPVENLRRLQALLAAIKSSPYPTTNFWMTEFTAPAHIMSLLGQNPAGLLMWEAYDSVFNHAILAGRGSTPPNDDTEGPALIAYNASTGVYTPRPEFYQVAQMIRFVPPGSIRVGASESSSSLTVYAFYDQTTRRVTIIGRNTSSSTISMKGTLSSLPTVGSLQLYQTYGSNNVARSGDVLVTAGAFFVTVQGNSYFTLTAIIP